MILLHLLLRHVLARGTCVWLPARGGTRAPRCSHRHRRFGLEKLVLMVWRIRRILAALVRAGAQARGLTALEG